MEPDPRHPSSQQPSRYVPAFKVMREGADPTPVDTCLECGSLVTDRLTHSQWHDEVARMYQVAVEAWLDEGNLRHLD